MTKDTKPTAGRYKTKASTRGGRRTGSGRPKGSTHKIKIEDLMQSVSDHTGMNYAERLALNYQMAIDRSDWAGVRDYDRAFMNKLVADKQEVEVTDSSDAIAQRQAAFAQALADLARASADNK